MDRRRTLLKTAAAGGLTALLTASVLFCLLTRLGDPSGACWARTAAAFAGIATIAVLTTLHLLDSPAAGNE